MHVALAPVHRAFETVSRPADASGRLYARLDAGRGSGVLAERMARRIWLGRGGSLQVLVGPPGAGLSTELRRLRRELTRAGGGDGAIPPRRVVFVDLAPELDPHAPRLADVVWHIAAAFARQGEAPPSGSPGGEPSPPAGRDGSASGAAREFAAAARDLMDVEADDEANGHAPADPFDRIARALRHDPSVRTAWRALHDRAAHRWLERLVRLVAATGAAQAPASDAALDRDTAPPVLILDGLDHLDRAHATEPAATDAAPGWRPLLASLERLLRELPCDVVMTAPYAALLGGRNATLRATTAMPVELLPFVRLRRRDGAPEERARTRMAEVATRRLRALDLVPDEVLPPAALARAVEASAGSPRQLLRLLQRATLEAGDLPIAHEHVEAACAHARRDFFDVIREDHRPLLEHVQLYYELNDLPDHAAIHAELFRLGAVHPYVEGDEVWFGLDPLLHERVI